MPLPGYVGSIAINGWLYGVKTLEPKETSDRLDTSNTESPVALIQTDAGAGVVNSLNRIKAFETAIQGFSRLKVRLTGDWAADAPINQAVLDASIVYAPSTPGAPPGNPTHYAGSFSQAGGGGYPPRFDINSPLFVDLRCGDRWVGFFLCEDYTDNLEVKGLISINLEMTSNGQYLKNPTANDLSALNAIATSKFGLPPNYFGITP